MKLAFGLIVCSIFPGIYIFGLFFKRRILNFKKKFKLKCLKKNYFYFTSFKQAFLAKRINKFSFSVDILEFSP